MIEFDALGRETKSQMNVDGLKQPVGFATTYNEYGLKSQVAASLGDYVNDYLYDENKKMVSIFQGDKRVEYMHNAAGQRVSTSVSSGMASVYDSFYDYDGMGRLMNLSHQNADGVIASYDYSWDAANRITGINDAEYGYDKTSQLVSAEYESLPKESYDYDANGNRKNFETGKNNQLISDGVFDYRYDAEGNRVEKKSKNGETTKYEWDHRNRLVKVVTPNEKVEYVYDFRNRLVKRNDEFFVHDGLQIALVLDKNGDVTKKNLWGANQDELIATNDSFMLCDHLGTVRDIIDAEGNVRNHLEYNAFGKLLKHDGVAPRIRYTGKPFDDTTGLQWNINRWYDAEVGRWISEDPIGFEGADSNVGRYAFNNPVNLRDDSGFAACCASSAPSRWCCNSATGFEMNYIQWGYPHAEDCVLALLAGVWWATGLTGYVVGGGATLFDWIMSQLSSKYGATVSLTLALGVEIAITNNYRNCLSWQCKSPRPASCCCTSAGYLCDTWECKCAGPNAMLLTDMYQEFYQTNPPSGSSSGTVCQSRWW